MHGGGDRGQYRINSNAPHPLAQHMHTTDPSHSPPCPPTHPLKRPTCPPAPSRRYEDLPLVQRLVPECDGLEAKIEYLVREILAYCIRWCVRTYVFGVPALFFCSLLRLCVFYTPKPERPS